MGLTHNLYELFLIDQQVRGLSRGLNAAGNLLKTQQTKLQQLQRQLAEITDQLRHADASAANAENDSNSIELRIQKLRDQMNSAKNNKEYSAMLVEVNTIKLDKGKAEEVALQHIQKAEQLKAHQEQVKAQIVEQEKLCVHAEQQVAGRRSEVGAQLDEVKARRAVAAQQVPAESLALFDKLSNATEGEAMAEVTHEDKFDDYHCGGCFMALPMETVNQLGSSDRIIRCTSCTRILYLATAARESLRK